MPLTAQVEDGLCAELSAAPAVLVLDNLETPWQVDTLEVERLLSRLVSLPGVRIVAGLRGTVRPLLDAAVQWAEPVEPRSLSLPDAKAMFLAVAGNEYEDDPALFDLLIPLEGVPLAINLMACAAQGQPLAAVRDRWLAERTHMLQRADANHPLLNLEISYEVSIRGPRMDEVSGRLLSTLAAFPGGVAHADLRSVFPEETFRVAGVLRQSALAFDEGDRLRLLAPLREYVEREHPPAADDWKVASGFYVDLATRQSPQVGRPGGDAAVRTLVPEKSNIQLSMLGQLHGTASPSDKDITAVVRAAVAFANFERLTGQGDVGALLRAATVARSRGEASLEASCIERLGDIARARSDHDTARQRYGEALPLYRQVGDIVGEANCIKGLGDIALARSDHDTARQRYGEALLLYRQVGDVLGEANCTFSLGVIAHERSDHEKARQRYEEALPFYRQVGDVLGEANCVRRLGVIALRHSDREAASQRCEEALLLYRQVGDVLGEANCIQNLGDLALARSDYETARQRYHEALLLYRQVGDVLGEANCIQSLGDLALVRSDHETARQRYHEALSLYRQISEPYSVGTTLRRIARIAQNDVERAEAVRACRAAWRSIARADLLAELDEEFGPA